MSANPARRIRQNEWGNWNGYVGRRKAIEFGLDQREAELWLADPDRYERERQEALEQSPAKYVPKTQPPLRFFNRYTKQLFELSQDKHPRGGLYVFLRHVGTGVHHSFHRSNLTSCFVPVPAKAQFVVGHTKEHQSGHQPVARDRVAYLLRAARSRRHTILVKKPSAGRRAYRITDCNLLIYPA